MPALLLALDEGASLVLTEAEPCLLLGRGPKTRLKSRLLSRKAAVCTLQQRAGQAAALGVTAGRAAIAVQRGGSPASPQLLQPGESMDLQEGDSLYLLASSGQLRYGYRVVSLPGEHGSGSGSGVMSDAGLEQQPLGQPQPAVHANRQALKAGAAARVDPSASAAAAAEAREARAAAAAAAEARIAAAAARHTSRAVAAVNRAREAAGAADQPVQPPTSVPSEAAATWQARPSKAAAAGASKGALASKAVDLVDLTLSDSDEQPQPAGPAAKRLRLASGGIGAATGAGAAAGAASAAIAAEPAAGIGGAAAAPAAQNGTRLDSQPGSRRRQEQQQGPSARAALAGMAPAEDYGGEDAEGEAGLLLRLPRGSHAGIAQHAQQHTTAQQLLPGGGPTTLRMLRRLQLKLDLLDAWDYLLAFSFGGTLAPQRIERDQLAAALAALRRPRVPLPLADPAEQQTFSVLSYNVWFESICAEERLAEIGRLIEQAPMRLPDFILLQEMTHAFYLRFAGMPWWQAYDATPLPAAPPFGPHYFTTILWQRDSFAGARCHPPHRFKEGCMGRDLKAVSGSLGGAPLRVCTTHLESPLGGPKKPMWAERRAQMDEMLPLLDCSPEPNCLVAGDMNWIHIKNVDEPVPLPPGWADVWLQLRPEERGWTYDTEVCYQKGRKWGRGSRMDRMFCRLADWEPLAIEMVGQEPIAGLTRTVRTGKTALSDKTIPVWPSDHFGLFAVFVRKQRPGSG